MGSTDTSPFYRVLIVDDAELAVDMLSTIFSYSTDFSVVGIARNGREGVEMAQQLSPDLITMDLHMPIMDGYDAVEEIMSKAPASIFVITSHREAETAFRCINSGALEVMDKPDLDCLKNPTFIRRFLDQARLLASTKVIRRPCSRRKIPQPVSSKAISPVSSKALSPVPARADHLLAIASSTGGPQALHRIFVSLPKDFPAAILVVQHLAKGFERGLVSWLSKASKVSVKLAEDKDVLRAGTIFIAPPDIHVGVGEDRCVRYIDAEPIAGHRPSAKYLFESGADVYGPECTGLILTGMGSDGAKALGQIKLAGGLTLAQDEQSSIIYGMPKVAVELGSAKEVISIDSIPSRLIDWVGN